MATYLQGVTDYIPQIQPFRPDYNFLGNVLQTKQTRYDSAKRQISDLYGSLLNGPMSRDSNIKRRDEFFKAIDQDIKKISGLDLSLQQNVDQAQNVFKGFYDDKYMVADMVKTKQYQNEIEKGYNSKNCYDQDKCGGVYNELSMRKLQYKMEEFKAASDDESLNFDIGTYDPYYNWQKDAIKQAKAAGLSVTLDKPSGKYIVRDKNGKLIEDGLYSLFEELYANDPRVAANYDTQAYVNRKEAVKSLMPKYNNDYKEAERAYITDSMNKGIKTLNSKLGIVNNTYDQLNGRQIELERKNGALTKAEKDELETIKQRKETVLSTKNSLQSRLDNIVLNMDEGNMPVLINKSDQAMAAAYQDEDLNKMAKTLAMVDEEHTYKEDPYQMALFNHGLAKDLEKFKNDLDAVNKVLQNQLDMKLKAYEKSLEKKGGKEGEQGTTEPQVVLGTPGASFNINQENVNAAYLNNAAETTKPNETIYQTSNQIMFQIVKAAQDAAKDNQTGAGARDYLDKTFGKNKWQNITTAEQVNSLIKTKGENPYIYLLKAKNYINDNPNTSWGKNVINKNNAQLSKLYIDFQASAAQTTYFKKGINKVVEVVGNSGDPDYRLAKYILNQYGTVEYSNTPTKEFITNYKKTRPNASMGDIEDAFVKVKSKFFDVYNRTPDVSFNQGKYLPGNAEGEGAMTSHGLLYTNVDSAETSDVNTEVKKTLNQLLAQPGKYKVLPGNLSADNYNSQKETSDAHDAFIKQFVIDLSNADEDNKERPIYNILVQGMAADDITKAGFTIVPSQAYVQQYYAKNKETAGLLDPSILVEGVSLFYDKKDVKTDITKALEVGKVEKILKNKGKLTIDAYKETAGTLDVTYDGNKVIIQPTYKIHEGDNVILWKGTPYVTDNIKNIDEVVDRYISVGLEGTQNKNFTVDEANRLLNQYKQ